MNYYLGPYQWVDDSWQPPATTIGTIDLRNLSHMGTPVVQDGIGFFATTGLLDASYDLLGQGDLREINSNAIMKSMWDSLLGYNPNGDKLVDLLYDQLTTGADPIGTATVRPLMPVKGNLTVYLHGKVKSTQFRFGHSPESNKVIAVLQEDYREIRNLSNLPVNHHRKVLDFWGKQYRIKDPHLLFIPNDLPVETPIPHSTSINENFDGADNAVVGKQLTWIEGGDGTFWDNFNNHARRLDVAGTSEQAVCRANFALSGTDQQCEVTIVAQTDNQTTNSGPTCRHSNSVTDYYMAKYLFIASGTDKIRIAKVVAGTETNLIETVVTSSIPDTVKLEVIGSDLESFFNGVSQDIITDTAITGNLFCGINGRSNSTVNTEMDDWSATDFIIAGVNGSALLVDLL